MESKNQPQPPPPPQVQIQIDASGAEGIYSNLVILAHSASEFILDFARILPGVPKAKVYSRIIMTPQNAKSLHKVLEAKLAVYEEQHGKIRLEPGHGSTRDIGF